MGMVLAIGNEGVRTRYTENVACTLCITGLGFVSSSFFSYAQVRKNFDTRSHMQLPLFWSASSGRFQAPLMRILQMLYSCFSCFHDLMRSI